MRKPALRPLSLSIVLPCHDEEASIAATIRAAVEAGRRVAGDLEVLVVDDGSRDGTRRRAHALAAHFPEVHVVGHSTNLGYGSALRRGFVAARNDWIFYTDADGQFDIDQLEELVPWLESHDVVCGFRLERRDGVLRALNGTAWTVLTNAVLGVGLRDVNCAFKIFPRALFDRIEMRSRGALIDAEVVLQARQLGLRIAEVGVRHYPRPAGAQSGGEPRVMARALAELGQLMGRLVMDPFRVRRLHVADRAETERSPRAT